MVDVAVWNQHDSLGSLLVNEEVAMPYREVQRFWLNRILLFIGAGLVAVAVVLAPSPAELLKGAPGGWTYAILGVPLLLSLVSLKIEVTADGVVYVGRRLGGRGP